MNSNSFFKIAVLSLFAASLSHCGKSHKKASAVADLTQARGFVDVTTTWDGAEWSNCDETPDRCTMRDTLGGRTWSKIQSTSETWNAAMDTCSALRHNGATDWRLPSRDELEGAKEDGAYSAASANWISRSQMLDGNFWSGSSVSHFPSQAWIVNLATGYSTENGKTVTYQVVCVR